MLVPRIDHRLEAMISKVCFDAKSDVTERDVLPWQVHRVLDCNPQLGINRLAGSIARRSCPVLRAVCPPLKWPLLRLCSEYAGLRRGGDGSRAMSGRDSGGVSALARRSAGFIAAHAAFRR